MTTFVALLRGINVGGNNKVPMADLRVLLSSMGFGNVRTYIQSGNVVFTAAEENCDTVRLQLETAIADRFGFFARVMVLTVNEIRDAIQQNPFSGSTIDPAKLHLGFMAASAEPSALERLRSKPQGSDHWSAMGRLFYLHAADGVGKSPLVPFVERTLKVPGTFRNWRTVAKLIELAS